MRRCRLFVTLLVAIAAVTALALPATAAVSALDAVMITGNPGEKPTISFAAPFGVKATQSDTVANGTGEAASTGSTIGFDYLILNGRTGQEIESSYGKQKGAMLLDTKQAQPAMVKHLIGSSAGSRVLVAIAPKEGLAKAAGNSNGIKKNDTLLFLFDIHDVTTPLERATGEAVAPVAGLPTVSLAESGKPTVTIPAGVEAPATLVVQPLIKGTGKVVEAADTIAVQYVGLVYRTGKVFDSSWGGTAFGVPIGTGQVVAGWDEGLVGQTVGSQVLLVIPPDKGYGPDGNPQIGVKGTDAMVFVIDILSAT